MIEVQVPKDITGYEPPFVGPLTVRQTVCVVAAVAVEYVYYFVLKVLGIPFTLTDGGSAPLLVGIALALPILYLAVGKPYGMRPEIYIYNYLLPSLLAPKDRPYATEITYDSILACIDAQEEIQRQKKKEPLKKKKKAQKSMRAQRRQDTIYA